MFNNFEVEDEDEDFEGENFGDGLFGSTFGGMMDQLARFDDTV